LLVVLWIRSYAYGDIFVWRFSDWRQLTAQSKKGEVSVSVRDTNVEWSRARSWYVNSTSRKRIEEIELLHADASLPKPVPRWGPRFLLSHNYFVIPHWFPALLTAMLFTVPWIRHLGWRFSLKTLLIAITCIAVVLGVIIVLSR
jgi:hypothetical protein